jgi:hypothetical protein
VVELALDLAGDAPVDSQPLGQVAGRSSPAAATACWSSKATSTDVDAVENDAGGSHRKGASGSGSIHGVATLIRPGQETLFTISPTSTDHHIGGFRLRGDHDTVGSG